MKYWAHGNLLGETKKHVENKREAGTKKAAIDMYFIGSSSFLLLSLLRLTMEAASSNLLGLKRSVVVILLLQIYQLPALSVIGGHLKGSLCPLRWGMGSIREMSLHCWEMPHSVVSPGEGHSWVHG